MIESQQTSASTPAFPQNHVNIHLVTPPAGKQNRFQQAIQLVQKSMGLKKFETTHLFASYNNQIIDRSGVYTIVSSGTDMIEFLHHSYPGYTIDTYSSDNPELVKNFKGLHAFIDQKKPYFFEDPTTGEVFGKSENYRPNNTVYAVGKETPQTLIGAAAAYLGVSKKPLISEPEAIKSALPNFKFTPSTDLANPTYCSLTLGGLIPSLCGQQILRYPALTHSFLDLAVQEAKYGLKYSRITIK